MAGVVRRVNRILHMPLGKGVESDAKPRPVSPLLVKERKVINQSPYAETEQLSQPTSPSGMVTNLAIK